MKLRGALWGGGLALLLFAAAAARFWFAQDGRALPTSPDDLPAATPPGILLMTTNGSERARIEAEAPIFFADAKGLALYRQAGMSTDRAAVCTAECMRDWPPALAPADARAGGAWSLVGAGVAKQWAWHGAPLHRHAADTGPGEIIGDSSASGWTLALFQPDATLKLPAGLRVREVVDAAGTALVDNHGMTLYTAAAVGSTAKPSGSHWTPVEAPALAHTKGAFQPVARDDGVTQWSFRGHPLFTFDGDRQPGDANGTGIDAGFQVALTSRLFMPANVMIRQELGLGTILVTAQNQTLYQRDRVTAGEERHPFRADHGAPALGRAYGTRSCDAQCAVAWPPFAAPADAQPSGYWDVLVRADGSKQWAYKGFALYTYAADRPGELGGNESYAFAEVGSSPSGPDPFAAPPGSGPGSGVGALFWHAVIP